MLERRLVQAEPHFRLSRPEQHCGPEEIPRSLGDRECNLELAKSFGKLSEQEISLAEEIAAEGRVDVALRPFGRLHAGTQQLQVDLRLLLEEVREPPATDQKSQVHCFG